MIDLSNTCGSILSIKGYDDDVHYSYLIHGDVNMKISSTKNRARKNLQTTSLRDITNGNSSTSKCFAETGNLASKQKTIYLIRHAESGENHRKRCLSRALQQVGKLILPSKEDVSASVELLDVKAQVDSDVSEKGRAQIENLAFQLKEDNFVVEEGIQLVAHSNLKRARQTSEGMLGCVAAKVDSSESVRNNGEMTHQMTCKTVKRVVELPCLAERTPLEWLPINHDVYLRRIAEFEMWLEEQQEERIAIVGHSQYFKSMLGLPYKFENCDVWRLSYESPVLGERSKSCQHVHVNDEMTQIFEDSRIPGFEAVRSEDSTERPLCEEEEREEKYDLTVEHSSLPRGWSNLANIYRYKGK